MALRAIARKKTESGATETTSTRSNSDEDEISTTSSDDALCDVLGLPSLSGMAMVFEDVDEEDPVRNPVGKPVVKLAALSTVIPRRIELPSVRGVSRRYYSSKECFAYEIQNILSPYECLELTRAAANSSFNNDDDAASSFRYITHAIHTAPDGQTKFEVKLERPNPHKLAVFRHESWVKIIWDRIEPFLHSHNHVASAADDDDNDDDNSEATPQNRETLQSDDDKSNCENTSLKQAIELFIQRESLSVSSPSETSPIAGINPRLRVLKYDACDEDEFQGHFDATTEIHSLGQTSYLTVLLYLNEGGGRDFNGGETEFLSQDEKCEEHKEENQSPGSKTVQIVPKAGSILLFEHDLFHRGRPLLWGTKYVLRTDIMFVNPRKQSSETNSAHCVNQQQSNKSNLSSPFPPTSKNDKARIALSTVEDVLYRIDQELRFESRQEVENSEIRQYKRQDSVLTLLRDALSEGLGFGGDLRDTTIECLCSPGRFALNLVLREHLQYQHQQWIIDRFLDASFEALKIKQT